MSHRHRLALLCLGFPALATASGCGGESSADPGPGSGPATTNTAADGTVTVDETEYRIVASPKQVAAGKVTFTVTNDGAIPHEFVVVRTSERAADLRSGIGADLHGKVGELDDRALTVGAKKALTLELKAGHYALVCNLPGHYQGGMYTDFTVK